MDVSWMSGRKVAAWIAAFGTLVLCISVAALVVALTT